MRRALSAIAVLLFAGSAGASVTQPNGLVVPRAAPSGEQNLSVFFSARGEAIDWIADANTTPDTFAPLCGFTAEFVLNEAGGRFGLAWYNADPAATAPPTGALLKTIIVAGAAVGTKITGADIAKDPAYKGGLIGFALVGGQTHYTERKWNPVCTACTPASPWVTALMYQSKTTANAYYVAFEDGNVTDSAFGNDGDYNDDVFFLTGLQCPGAGTKCDTGKKGVCALGANSCEGGKLVCKQAVAPGAKTCNGLDNDCDGVLDDGPCPTGTICTRGACIPTCGTGEFKCSGGSVCDKGVCVEPPCVGKTCPDGQTCVKGDCVDACGGVKCPVGQFCTGGTCIDPCAFLKCATGEVCDEGLCKPDCSCAPCPSGKSCDTATKKCVAPACVGKTCAAGTRCDAATGVCVDACTAVVCPKGQACTMGKCVAVSDPGDAGPDASSDADPGDTSISFDSGDLDDAGADTSGGPDNFLEPDDKEPIGCSCDTPGTRSTAGGAWLLLALVATLRGRRNV
jgi:hypothetical protein